MKDNGRIKMESYHGILYCEAYMDGEFTVEDVDSVTNEITEHYNGYSDVIFNKVGSYSINAEAQIKLELKVKEFRNFIYVADTAIKKHSSEFAAKSYMEPYNTKVASTKEEAYKILKSLS